VVVVDGATVVVVAGGALVVVGAVDVVTTTAVVEVISVDRVALVSTTSGSAEHPTAIKTVPERTATSLLTHCSLVSPN
jgi:hypothetical protein